MPDVKEEKLSSSLFIMQDASPTKIGPVVDPNMGPRVQHGI